jgi:hypothetical protein
MRIKDIDHALALYEKHNIIRGEALEEGNSSKANYHFDKVQETIGFLKAQNAITELFKLLKHPHPYVRLNAAVQLKDHDEKGCLEVVKSIEKNEKGIVSLNAKLCIQAFWEKSISEKDAKINNTPTERIIIENRAAFSSLPFDTHLRPLKEMKSLIKEYSQRDDIFRKQNMLFL